jgi:hypothetical protein
MSTRRRSAQASAPIRFFLHSVHRLDLYPYKHFTEHLVARVRVITTEVQFKLRNLELFDLVAQEYTGFNLPQSTHN